MLNLIIIVGTNKISNAIFQLKEIQRNINDIYYLIYNFINNNQKESKPILEEIQKQKNDDQNKSSILMAEDMKKLKEENAKMHQDILSINQKIDSLIVAVDNIKNNQLNNNNQPPKKDKNTEQQIKNLENKINYLTKENCELKDQLNKTKNTVKSGETKTGKEKIQENKMIKNNDKNQNIIRTKFINENNNQKTRIMNHDQNNEKQLSEYFEIYVDGEIIPFSWEYQLSSSIHNIEYKLKNTEINEISLSNMFNNCNYLRAIDFSNFDSSKIINMDSMFSNCSWLNSVNFGNDFSIVTNMSQLFANCKYLTKLDLSYLNTENVTNMSSMFYYCSTLKSLDLSNFNTENVTNMNSMFSYCSALKSLELSNFNTSDVSHMENMFDCCTNLKTLDISNFNTINVISFKSAFSMCDIETLNINQQDNNLIDYLKENNIKYIIKK